MGLYVSTGGMLNVRAETVADGIGGQTPLFHSVNSNHNLPQPLPTRDGILTGVGADLDVLLGGSSKNKRDSSYGLYSNTVPMV